MAVALFSCWSSWGQAEGRGDPGVRPGRAACKDSDTCGNAEASIQEPHTQVRGRSAPPPQQLGSTTSLRSSFSSWSLRSLL